MENDKEVECEIENTHKTKSTEQCKQTYRKRASEVDGGYGWAVVFGSFLSHVFLLGMVRCSGILYIELLRKFNESAKQTASLTAIFNTLRMVTAPFVSVVCKRLSCRVCMMIGSVVLCMGLVASAFATSLWFVTVSYGIVGGLFASFLFTPPYIIVGQYFDKRKGLAMSLGTVGAGLGAVVLAPLLVYLFHTYSYFGTMIILGGLQLHHCVSGALFKPFRGHKPQLEMIEDKLQVIVSREDLDSYENKLKENVCERKPSDKYEEGITSINSQHQSVNGNMNDKIPGNHLSKDSLFKGINNKMIEKHAANDKLFEGKNKDQVISELICKESAFEDTGCESITKSKEIVEDSGGLSVNKSTCCGRLTRSIKKKLLLFKSLTMWLYGFTVASMPICNGTVIFFVSDTTKLLGATDTQAALVLSFFSVFDVLGRLTWGLVFDMKMFRTRRRMLFSIIGLACAALCGLHGILTNYYAIIFCVCVFGFFEGGFHAQRVTIVSEFVEKSMIPETVGVSIFFQGLGNIVGPILGGFVKDNYGNYSLAYFLAGGIQGVSCVLFLINYVFRDKKLPC